MCYPGKAYFVVFITLSICTQHTETEPVAFSMVVTLMTECCYVNLRILFEFIAAVRVSVLYTLVDKMQCGLFSITAIDWLSSVACTGVIKKLFNIYDVLFALCTNHTLCSKQRPSYA